MARGVLTLVRAGSGLVLVAGLLMSSPGGARSQSLGLEAGWAGVENYDPLSASFGLSIFAPLAERWSGSLTYTRWTGEDGNYGTDGFSGQGWTYFGNQGLNATVLYRVLGAERLSWSLGGGLGLYDTFSEDAGERDHSLRTALTASTLWRYGLSPSTGVYVRGDISLHDVVRPNWGFLRLGLQWSPWARATR